MAAPLSVILTRRAPDRQGDLVEPAGLDFDAYLHNPVVLWAHDLARPPIARVTRIERTADAVLADIEFADTPLAQEIHRLYEDGFLNAWSLGFLPRVRRPLSAGSIPPPPYTGVTPTVLYAADRPAAKAVRALPCDAEPSRKAWPANAAAQRDAHDGYHILAAEVVEVSAVPVPAHPEALTFAAERVRHPLLRAALRRQDAGNGRDDATAKGGAPSRWRVTPSQLGQAGAHLLHRLVDAAAYAALREPDAVGARG